MNTRLKLKKPNIGQKKGSLNNIKTPFLLEHTNRMEQKLSFLKEKILEQKKNKPKQKSVIECSDRELSQFLTKIGMHIYTQKLIQNGIDSFEILKQIKQSELQEIGISKGHSLKIMIHLKRSQEQKTKISQKRKIQQKSDRVQTPNQSTAIIQHQSYDSCQTESYPIQDKLKLFCLFCYKKSQHNFCSKICENHYERMFQKYEQNLRHAQQNFIPNSKPTQQAHQQQQAILNFDFLFQKKEDDEFNKEEYSEIIEIIKK